MIIEIHDITKVGLNGTVSVYYVKLKNNKLIEGSDIICKVIPKWSTINQLIVKFHIFNWNLEKTKRYECLRLYASEVKKFKKLVKEHY